MRVIKAHIYHSISEEGLIEMRCAIPLTEKEVKQFKKVLPQGSSFLSPKIEENSITYFLKEEYDSKRHAKKHLKSRLELFKMFVRSRTELTINCDLNLAYDL